MSAISYHHLAQRVSFSAGLVAEAGVLLMVGTLVAGRGVVDGGDTCRRQVYSNDDHVEIIGISSSVGCRKVVLQPSVTVMLLTMFGIGDACRDVGVVSWRVLAGATESRKVGCVGVWDALCAVTVGPPPPPHSGAGDETGPHAHTPYMHTHRLLVSARTPHHTDIIKSHMHTHLYTHSQTRTVRTHIYRYSLYALKPRYVQTKRTLVTSPSHQHKLHFIPTGLYSSLYSPSLMQAPTALAYRY